MIKDPLGLWEPRIVLNSLYNTILILLISTFLLLEIIHKLGVKIIINSTLDTQFIEVDKEVEGSKIEKRFLIIFI